MMKRCLIVLFLLTAMMVPADEFEDYTVELARISRGYKSASRLAGSTQETDFQESFLKLQQLSVPVQNSIRRLNLGNDYDFPELSRALYKIYLGLIERSRKDLPKQMGVSNDPKPFFLTLLADIKSLRKMEFTTEDGGSIAPLAATKRRIREYQRCLDFFEKMKSYDLDEKTHSSFKPFFDQRTANLQTLAKTLDAKIPKGGQKYSLQQETSRMFHYYLKWKDLKQKELASKERNRTKNKSNRNSWKKGNSKHKKSDINARDREELKIAGSEMNTSIRRIMEILAIMEQSGAVSDSPLSGGENKAVQPESEDLPSGKYDRLSRKELEKKLQLRRNEVFKSNPDLNGFDSKTRHRYIQLLAPSQKKSYNLYFQDYKKRGYETSLAERTAMLQLHAAVKMQDMKELKDSDIIKILEKDDLAVKKEYDLK